jgi:hypothetical protein
LRKWDASENAGFLMSYKRAQGRGALFIPSSDLEPLRYTVCLSAYIITKFQLSLGLHLVVVPRASAHSETTMLTGKRFRLERATVAVKVVDQKRTAFTVPAGAIVNVLPEPADSHELVTVLWEEHKLQMFAVDVDVRGTEVQDPEMEHGQSRKTASG